MPEPPDVGIITRYVLENPWPLGGVLLAVATWLIWSGLREGLMNKVKAGGGLAIAGAVVIATGILVVTSGEHARIVTRRLVDAVVAGDVQLALAQFAPGAAFAMASPKNPGYGLQVIEEQLINVTGRYPIDSNTITMLRGYSESSDAAVVHLACFTQVAASPYPTVSTWAVRVQRQDDGQWRIVHLTWVSINDQTPQIGTLR